jgi:ribosomal protein S7
VRSGKICLTKDFGWKNMQRFDFSISYLIKTLMVEVNGKYYESENAAKTACKQDAKITGQNPIHYYKQNEGDYLV